MTEKSCLNCGAPISKETCEGFPEVCESWRPIKPQSNYDKLRNMTLNQLVGWLRVFYPEVCPLWTHCPGEDDCAGCWLDWLKSTEGVDA